MNLSIFLARRLSLTSKGLGKSGNHSSLLTLATAGVTLSMIVMLVALSIVLGFRKQIRSYAYSQTGQISLYAMGEHWLSSQRAIELSPSLVGYVRARPYIDGVTLIVQQTALLKTNETFAGALLYGVDSLAELGYYDTALREGYIPRFGSVDSVANPIVLPSQLADQLEYRLGDKVRVYFFGSKIRVRAYTLVGIYESAGVHSMPALCSARSLQRVSNWGDDDYTRMAIYLKEGVNAVEIANQLSEELSSTSFLSDKPLGLNIGEELMPDIFGWLTLIDSNVYVLLVLMILVGGFAMVTGLIIIVLDKSRHIGILKALGATDGQLRRVFILLAQKVVIRAMLIANSVAGLLCYVQWQYRPLRLDPTSYFMDAVPISWDLFVWLGINLGTMALIYILLIFPSAIISRIAPSQVMKQE